MKSPSWLVIPCLLLLLPGCGSVSGSAGSCALTREAELPVTFARNLPIVDVTLDGVVVKMVLDTGSNATVMTEKAFLRLGIATDSLLRGTVVGFGGSASHHIAVVDRVGLGTAASRRVNVFVVPRENFPGDAEGLLGADILGKFDVDLDMPHSRVGLYHQRNCPAGRPDWTTNAQTLIGAPQGRSVLPNIVRVELDKTPLVALIDSGAAASMVDRNWALRSGTTAQALDAHRKFQGSGATETKYAVVSHRFDSLTVGDEEIAAPLIAVTTTANASLSGSFGMVLGEDYLRRHRVWIAYEDYKVFISKP